MKKNLLVALTTLPLMAYAGLMDSLAETVTKNVKDTTKTALSSATDNAYNNIIKKILKIEVDQTNKLSIENKLGAPSIIKNEFNTEVWIYNLDILSKKYPALAESTAVLLQDTIAVKKVVVIKFMDDVVKEATLADKIQG